MRVWMRGRGETYTKIALKPSSRPSITNTWRGGKKRRKQTKREAHMAERETHTGKEKEKTSESHSATLKDLTLKRIQTHRNAKSLKSKRKERGGKVLMTVESSDRAARTAVETLAEAAVAGDQSPAAGARMSLASRLYCYRLGREGTAS